MPQDSKCRFAQIRQKWDSMSEMYTSADSGPQTFFYTLVNMLQLQHATNILEVACGAGKLIPMVLDLKPQSTLYYATDISEKMVKVARHRLQIHFQKYHSKLSFHEWIKTMNLQFEVANGEEEIAKKVKFDRIICNLVLMHTDNPQRMLANLFESAEENCLMGLSVWGNPEKNPFFHTLQQFAQELSGSEQPIHSGFCLYKKIESMVEEKGWQVVLNWQQVGIYPFIEHDPSTMPLFMRSIYDRYPEQIQKRFLGLLHQLINVRKQGIQFCCQMLIVKKKAKS